MGLFPSLVFFISVIVFWIITCFRRQNSVRLRCFFADTDIIQSVSILLASAFGATGVELSEKNISTLEFELKPTIIPWSNVWSWAWVSSFKDEDAWSSVGDGALPVRAHSFIFQMKNKYGCWLQSICTQSFLHPVDVHSSAFLIQVRCCPRCSKYFLFNGGLSTVLVRRWTFYFIFLPTGKHSMCKKLILKTKVMKAWWKLKCCLQFSFYFIAVGLFHYLWLV